MIARRLLAEHRVRLPLIVLRVAVFGFAAGRRVRGRRRRDAGIERLRQRRHRLPAARPRSARGLGVARADRTRIFLVLSALYAVSARGTGGGGRARGRHPRADAGAARLARRATSRRTSRLLVPGCMLIALAYATGTLLGDHVFDAPGAPLVAGRLLLAALQSALLLLAVGVLAVLVSALTSERGRALSWVLGITIGMYAANFLLVLWSRPATSPGSPSSGTSRPAARSRPATSRGATWPCWQGGASPPRGRPSHTFDVEISSADARATPHRCRSQFGSPRRSAALPLRGPRRPRAWCTLTTSDAAVVLAALRPTVEQPCNEPEQSSSEREVRCAEDDQDPSIHSPSVPRLTAMSRHGIVTVPADAPRPAQEPDPRRSLRDLPALRLRTPVPGAASRCRPTRRAPTAATSWWWSAPPAPRRSSR